MAPATAKAGKRTKPRTSRFILDPLRRGEHPLSLIPQGAEILSTIDQCTCLTNVQVAELLFCDTPAENGVPRRDDAAHRAASRSLEKLWESELIVRHRVKRTARSKPQAYVTFVNVLTAKGASTLRDHYEQIDSQLPVRWTPQVDDILNHHLEHRLALYDFYVIATRACRRQGVTLAAWWDDRELTAQTKQGAIHFISIPDAVMVLRTGNHTGMAFVEMDRGRETAQAVTVGRRDWRTKVAGYLQYLATSYPQEAFFAGVPEPTILTVTTNRPRMLSLIDATQVAGGDDRFWFTTLDDVDPLPAADGSPTPPAFNVFWKAIWTTGGSQHPRSLRFLLH